MTAGAWCSSWRGSDPVCKIAGAARFDWSSGRLRKVPAASDVDDSLMRLADGRDVSAWLCLVLVLAQGGEQRIWLDSTSGDLSADQWREVEGLLRAGLKRKGLEVSREREPPATLVVQIRRIQHEYFVFAASGPAVAGSGVTMSRRVALSSIPDGALGLVLAQTAEELIHSALSPAPVAPVVQAPTVAAVSEPLPPSVEPALPWRFTFEALVGADVFRGGAVTVTGGALASAQVGRWGLSLSGGAGALAPSRSETGVVSGTTVWGALGPHVEIFEVGAFRLATIANLRAQWVRAGGSNPSSGFLSASGEGWAVMVLAGVAPALQLNDVMCLRLALSVGAVVRGVTFTIEETRLLSLTGLTGSASLSLGGRW